MTEKALTQEEIQMLLNSGTEGETVLGPKQNARTEENKETEPSGYESEKPADELSKGPNPDSTQTSRTEERTPSVRPMVFEELPKASAVQAPISGMDVLLDIPLSVSVELGKTKCYVKDLLNLTSGSIMELDRLAGDPVDILVNGKAFAKGEVVVIDENFGVRIREILGQNKKQ